LHYKDKTYTNIEFLGYKSGEELWNLVRNASFIIVPSECYENNPLTILEAYAHGKPVIGAHIGGIPELIENGKTGFLFKPGDKNQLQEILSEANRLEESKYLQMSKNVLAFANNNFNPGIYYKNLMEIYMKVINNV
jgi:glycosyltransferase involved in cell wall biosynthesis